MSSDAAEQVWLSEGGDWKLVADPVPWSGGSDDVLEKYAEAGYTESSKGQAAAFLVLGLGENDAGGFPTRFSLFLRSENPECLIHIEDPAGSSRAVFGARLPDGLDLMACWAPIAQSGMLEVVIKDLMQPATGYSGKPDRTGGLVEAVTRRALKALP